jgi:hypothetical protein
MKPLAKLDRMTTIAVDDKEGRLAQRAIIEQFKTSMESEYGRGDMDDIDEKGLTEHFVNGAYIRQLMIPKDTTMVSELWDRERFWIISEGEVEVLTELGKQRIKAPYYGMAPFGSRVALYALEDTMWFAITGVESTEGGKTVKKEIVAEDYDELPYPWDKQLENKK